MLRHHRLPLFWIAAVAGLLAPWALASSRTDDDAPGPDRECRVESIYDGDTMTIRCAVAEEVKSIYCIDAPEIAQRPWGLRSRDNLRRLATDTVWLRIEGKDRYGRTIAEAWAGGTNLNLAQVRSGHAAEYDPYCGLSHYRGAEQVAKKAGQGIWSTPGTHQAPWSWRND